jgi:GntR family transcriptional regulator / MocR family aminotransferase
MRGHMKEAQLTTLTGPIHSGFMDVHVTLEGRGDLSARIYRQLFEAVLDGRLRAGEALPPTRELARRVGVSRNTVAVAYDRLAAEGVVEGRVGAGTFVCAVRPARARHARRAPAGAGVRPRSVWSTIPPPAHATTTPAMYDFRVGRPDPGLFPFTAWRRVIGRELRLRSSDWTTYGDPSGHPGLRAAIARHTGISRAVRADADDVIVTQGAQQAFDLIARVLIEPGDCVAVEEPGYPPARLLFRSLGAKVVGVPVDDEGLDVARVPKRARLVYVTPSHQFPLGTAMSLRRRSALLEWADQRGAVVIEDDYDSEFRFEGRPLDPIQSLDRAGRVIYVGSFSKVMLPALRVGFLIAPASLQSALRTAKQLTDWHGELPLQAALAGFIDEGLLARHVRKAAREYQRRHALVIETIRAELHPWLRVIPAAAGLHVATRAAEGASIDLDEIAKQAGDRGVIVRTLRHFSADTPARAGLVIGFGSIPAATIGEGIRRLALCFPRSNRRRR